jgi:hypothetical protein
MRRERPRHGLNQNDDRKQEREHNPRLHGEQPRFFQGNLTPNLAIASQPGRLSPSAEMKPSDAHLGALIQRSWKRRSAR